MATKTQNWHWFIGYSLLMIMVGTNIPSPLYGVYMKMWGLSSGTLTLVFATYALCIIPSLLLFGQLSDRFGRKKILIPGLLVSALGSLLFVISNDVTWLFIARAIQGISVGIVSGAATAAIAELHPRNDRKIAALVTSAATAAGTAIGPLFSGILAEYGPWKTGLPFVVHIVFLVPGLISMFLMPETVHTQSAKSWKLQRPSVPLEIRTLFLLGSTIAFIAWSVTALFMSVVPSYVTGLLHIKSLAISGGVVFLMLGASTIVQFVCKRLNSYISGSIGLLLLAIGLAGIVFAYPTQSIWLLLSGTLVSGCGQGLAFMGSMALVNEVTPISRKADVISSFYVVIYVGVAIPVIAVGYAAQSIGLFGSIRAFALIIGILSILVSILVLKRMSLTRSEIRIKQTTELR